MKRRIIAILVSVTLVCATTACTSDTYTSSTNTSGEEKGHYFCYSTYNTKDYLNFLEVLDEEKYEIVDISHSHSYWYVTYKLKD